MCDAAFKGRLKTATGFPVALTNVLSVDTIEIRGNAKQDGTPTPTAPVEVGGVGEKTANLFYDNFVSTANQATMELNLEPNTAYTLRSVTKASILYVSAVAADNKTLTQLVRKEVGAYVLSFTTGETGKIQIRITKPSTVEDLSSWQLVKGTYTSATMPAYEPYGYKIPLNARNNLYDGESPVKFSKSAYVINLFPIKVENNTNYVFRFKYKTENNVNVRFAYAVKNESKANITNGNNTAAGVPNGELSAKFNSGTNSTIYLSIYQDYVNIDGANKVADALYYDFAVETEMPNSVYNIYLDAPLYKVGDYADKIKVDFTRKTAVVERNVEKLTLDGSEDWKNSRLQVEGYYRKYVARAWLGSYVDYDKYQCLCNAFPRKVWSYAQAGNKAEYISAAPTYIHISLKVTTATDFNTWIDTTKPYVILPLAIAETTDLSDLQDWSTVPKFGHGNITLSADTLVQPSGGEVKYFC